MDPKLAKVQKLYAMFQQGQIPRLQEHEVHPDLDLSSRENYLYFTLPVALNFQRSSLSLWQSALKTWQDPNTRYLYFPERITKEPFEKIQVDLAKHKLALQKNKHPRIWLTVCQTLNQNYNDDPREIFRATNFQVHRLFHLLRKERKVEFPYLSGPKMSSYWPYILSLYTDIKFKDPYLISIIPDTHVLQSTIKLGFAPRDSSPTEIIEIWKNLLANSNLTPVQLHPVLWNWSRNNFQPEV